jgi:formylglycine-generating enzyme required for sulfatase activity
MARSPSGRPLLAALGLGLSAAVLSAACAERSHDAEPTPREDEVVAATPREEATPKRESPTVNAAVVKETGGAVVPASAASPSGPCPEGMVLVPGGTVSSLETGDAAHVADFCLDAREVTVADFRAAVEKGTAARVGCGESCAPVPTRSDWGDPSEDWIASKFCNGARKGRDGHPVNCVAIEEARLFCAGRGGRLPNGDEWEWAARGAGRMSTPWGTPVAKAEICWGKPRKRDGTCESGDHPSDRTSVGVFDLGGNLSEWTEPPQRAHAAPGARFAHGASWYAIDDGYARAALGGFETPAVRAETIGFRCAADAKR